VFLGELARDGYRGLFQNPVDADLKFGLAVVDDMRMERVEPLGSPPFRALSRLQPALQRILDLAVCPYSRRPVSVGDPRC
jgi:hypothetical protein